MQKQSQITQIPNHHHREKQPNTKPIKQSVTNSTNPTKLSVTATLKVKILTNTIHQINYPTKHKVIIYQLYTIRILQSTKLHKIISETMKTKSKRTQA